MIGIKKISGRKKGYKHSDKTKTKIRNKLKGRKLLKISIEKRTENRRKNGWWKNQEKTKKNQSLSAIGRTQSKESNEKNRLSHLGRKNPKSSETKKRQFAEGVIIHPLQGKHHPEKAKKKMSETRKRLFKERKIPKINKGTFKKGDQRISGKNNPSWNGGTSFEPYTKEFNNKFKRAIRKRDNQICMLCWIHREKINKVLSVHHINYDKLLSIKENCISLCNSCHSKTNTNREHWIKFFQSLLSEKYNYKYSENKEIVVELQNGRN